MHGRVLGWLLFTSIPCAGIAEEPLRIEYHRAHAVVSGDAGQIEFMLEAWQESVTPGWKNDVRYSSEIHCRLKRWSTYLAEDGYIEFAIETDRDQRAFIAALYACLRFVPAPLF